MPSISSEQPPIDTDIYLAEYLNRMFVDINIALSQNGKAPKLTVLPDKPQSGNYYYFSIPILPDITHIGFWGYVEGTWKEITSL